MVNNHEDYRNNVTIDEERINGWESTFVTVELLDSIGHVSDPSAEDASRDGFGMDNADDDETADDLPFTSSGVVDVNNIAEIPDAITPTCFKYRSKKCRFQFPRLIVVKTRFDEATGVIYIK